MLASPRTGNVTGSNYIIDGGLIKTLSVRSSAYINVESPILKQIVGALKTLESSANEKPTIQANDY